MNFFKKIIQKQKDPDQWDYHYNPKKTKFNNVSDNYFIKESTGQIIRITARDALDMIVFQDMGYSPKRIFNVCRKEHIFDNLGAWDNDIGLDDVVLWLHEFNKGNMDQAIFYICENQIEEVDDDPLEYIKLKK